MFVIAEGGALTPPAFVGACLAQHLRARRPAPFMLAWTHALQSLPRGTTAEVIAERLAWVEILKWSRPAWQAAYERRRLGAVLTDAEPARTRFAAAA